MLIFFRKHVNIDNFEANRKYYKQTFLLFSSRIFDLGIGFATNMFIAKHLQQEQFGIYSFVLNFLLLISLLFDFGFFTSISRILAFNVMKEENKMKEFHFI
ncbi:MAG: oligosaccharide flippase family protein [Bacteroidetes bacterium]|nr:oligosaccharide flippase family protein [Bacteroidota bacterium]